MRMMQQKFPVHSTFSEVGEVSKPSWGEFEAFLEKGVRESLNIQWEEQVRKNNIPGCLLLQN